MKFQFGRCHLYVRSNPISWYYLRMGFKFIRYKYRQFPVNMQFTILRERRWKASVFYDITIRKCSEYWNMKNDAILHLPWRKFFDFHFWTTKKLAQKTWVSHQNISYDVSRFRFHTHIKTVKILTKLPLVPKNFLTWNTEKDHTVNIWAFLLYVCLKLIITV